MLRHCSLIMLLFTALCAVALPASELEKEFQRLDSVVDAAQDYIEAKETEIRTIKKGLTSALTHSDKYAIYDRVFNEYLKFNSDSAMHYAYLCAVEADSLNDKTLEIMSDLKLASITTLRSELYVARDVLNTLGDISKMPESTQTFCAIIRLEFCMRANLFFNKNDMDHEFCNEKYVWDKFSPYLPEKSWLHTYYQCSVLRVNKPDELYSEIIVTPKPSIKAAMLESALASCYQRLGKKDEHILHLIHSAINDISCANREAQSLIYLINSDYIDRCSPRAFNYTMLCTENAEVYRDSGRSLAVVNAHAQITKKYEQTLQRRAWQLSFVIMLLVVVLAIVGILLYVIYQKRNRQRELLVKISKINEELAEKNRADEVLHAELKESNARLKSEIDHRNSHFINVYTVITKYITAMKAFKKDVYNLITAGKYDRARSSLSSNEITDEYLKQFYVQFDIAFLLSHPDFIERFNTLLAEDKRIWPTEANRLTPELRIYALICMGITDSTRIAEFLQYSPQTIYNYRLRVRHSAIIPEKEFATTVEHMYDSE